MAVAASHEPTGHGPLRPGPSNAAARADEKKSQPVGPGRGTTHEALHGAANEDPADARLSAAPSAAPTAALLFVRTNHLA